MGVLETVPSRDLFDLRSQVENRESVQVSESLESVRELFEQHPYDYVAVLDGGRLVGLTSRSRVGMALGSRYGHAVFARRRICDTAAMLPATTIHENLPIDRALSAAFSRNEATLFDDVALLSESGEFIGLVFARTLVKIQNELLFRKIRLMQEDLLMAREIQNALLPRSYPKPLGNGLGPQRPLQFAHRFLPADTVSGDFFHTQQIDECAAGIFICDVMGHGVRSAFVTALLRALVEQMRHYGRQPDKLMAEVNRELLSILPNEDVLMLASAIYLVLDVERKEILFANAGHPDPILIDSLNGTARLARSEAGIGPALGLLPDSDYDTMRCDFRPGDTLFLYTDGIYEIIDSNGDELSKRGLVSLAERHAQQQPETLLDTVLEHARNFSRAPNFDDDICLVAVRNPA